MSVILKINVFKCFSMSLIYAILLLIFLMSTIIIISILLATMITLSLQ